MALSTISGTTGITDATITSAKLADFSAAVDLNGVELLLDADQDTSITADTDDRIDFKIAGVEHISISNSSGDTIIKPMVDAKDIVFQQYDGNKILEINDGNYVAISGAAAGPGELRFYEDTDLGSHYTGFKAGNATASISYVLPLADGTSGYALTTNGSGTLSWSSVSSAADDISTGDAAITIATSSGNITLDAQAGDADIIFKGTDSSSDITALTLDMSDAGTAVFNHDIRIADDGQIGSASDADAIVINSSGVVTMNQIPVFSAGINVSGGSIAGTLSTAAQANITSLGTLTALTVDDVAVNGKVITMTGSTDDTAVLTVATNGALTLETTDTAAAAANIQITADGTFEVDGTTITLDSAGDIVLDADGADIIFKDGGTAILTFTNSSSDAVITSGVQDKDIVFKGDDGGSAITALTLDMSAAGAATFNDKVTATELDISGNCDIDGTTNLDAVDIDGAVQIDAAVTVGVNDTGYDVKFFGATSGAYMLWDESTDDLVLAGAAQLYLYDAGGGESLSSDGTDLTINSGAKINLTATSDVHIPNNVGIVFGGDSEKIEGDGTDLTISANNLTIDCAADLILDAAGNNITLKSGGTSLLDFVNSSSDVVIKPMVDAKDIIFQQYDGTSILEINDGAYAKFTAAAVAPEATLTDASTISWNALTQSVAKVTLGANRTMGSASSGVTGQFISLLVIQDGTGSRTVSWNAAYEFAADTAPTLTTTASKGDLFVFRYNGSKWLEVGRNLALTLS